MKFKTTTLLVILLLCINAFSQENEESSAGGPITKKSQLVGYWKMIELPKKEMNKTNPWPLPYQWFYFDTNGKVYSMMASENKEYTLKELKDIFSLLPNNKTPNFSIEGQFVIIDNPERKGYLEIWGANIFAQDIEGLANKGDLIMTLDESNKKNQITGNVVYYRLLRPIKK